MLKKLYLFLLMLSAVSIAWGQPIDLPVAEVVERHTFDCFSPGLEYEPGELVHCETSAAVFDGQAVIFASDKDIPGASAVFTYDYWRDEVTYHVYQPFLDAIKFEDMTRTPNGAHVIATTAFDRVQDASNEWDGYNSLIYWSAGVPWMATVASPTNNEGIVSSVGLRDDFAQAMRTYSYPVGPPYFKIEGLAAVPGNRLLFGVREFGDRYDDFQYAIRIIAVSYAFRDGVLELGSDYEMVYDFNPDNAVPELDTEVALSSLEYDLYNDRLYLLTSFELEETDTGLGAYLWTLPLFALGTETEPNLVIKPDGSPLLFAHKGEGITVLNRNRVLVVHDDDRVLGDPEVNDLEREFRREPHQAAYTIVEFID